MMQINEKITQEKRELPVASPRGAQLATLSKNQRNQAKFRVSSLGLKALADKVLANNLDCCFVEPTSKITSNFLPQTNPQKLRPEQPYFGLEIEQLKTLAADDWDEVKDNPAMLKAMVDTYVMLKGLDPEISSIIYTKTVHCQHCGEIKTWPSCPHNKVLCCQWCMVNNDLLWG